jgi:hypothetical protein
MDRHRRRPKAFLLRLSQVDLKTQAGPIVLWPQAADCRSRPERPQGAKLDGAEMGDEIGTTLARRFPQHTSKIRRLRARDPDFRSICDDYDDARRALKHWEAASQAAPERIAEYREILRELEAEALAILEAFQGN